MNGIQFVTSHCETQNANTAISYPISWQSHIFQTESVALTFVGGIRVDRKRNWKKREVGKLLFKLERAKQSLKEPSEVEKNQGWRISSEVGKLRDSLKVKMN